ERGDLMRRHYPGLLLLLAGGVLTAADAGYVGKWKMNPAKSDFGQSTITMEQLPSGDMKSTMDGQSYTYKLDGKEYPTPWGMTMAWKSVDANTWETVARTNGKVSETATWKLSPDGKTLTADVKRVKADGGTSDDSLVLQRISGGPGLKGKWRTKKNEARSPETLTHAAKGDGPAPPGAKA